MFDLFQKEKALETVVIFIATYLIALAIGRLMKRRGGVPFGIQYQIFCLALAFYAAIRVWGLAVPWGGHVGALLVLLSTAVIVALLDRYLWDQYFQERKHIIIPRLLRETVALGLFLVALLLVLSFGYHAETATERCAGRFRRGRNYPRLCRAKFSQQPLCRPLFANRAAIPGGRLA